MSDHQLATAPPVIASTAISMFANAELFDLVQRQAKLIAASDLIPKQFQGNLANCAIALEMASRLGASPFAVIQNLDVIHGRPSWRAVFLMGLVNNCGRFTPLQFKLEVTGKEKTVEMTIEGWDNGKKVSKPLKYTYTPTRCVAWARDKATGDVIEGPPVSYDMAIEEGWVSKSGSKWQTELRELMLRYRAASFFAKVYASDVMLGMQTTEEAYDIGPEMKQAAGREIPATAPETPKANPFKDEAPAKTAPATVEAATEPVTEATVEVAFDRTAKLRELAAAVKASGRKNAEALTIFREAGLLGPDAKAISDATDDQIEAMLAALHLLKKTAEELAPEPIETPTPTEAWLDRIEELGLQQEPALKLHQIEALCRKAKVLSTTETLKGCAVKRLEGFHANFAAILEKAGKEEA